MDASTAIIALVFIAFISIPFVFMSRAQRKKGKQFSTVFELAAKQQNLQIAQKEFWNSKYGIGIDANSRKLLYLKKKGEEVQQTLIDLSEVEKCRVANHSRGVKTHNTAAKVIDRIDLVLTFRTPGAAEKNLEFYSVDESLIIGKEVLLAEKWLKLINTR